MLSKKALISALFVCGSLAANAQTSSNSPYTRYGLGDLSDQISTNNAAMGGVGYALRTSWHINPMNPASYTAVDSLSFMFDAGVSLRSSNYQEKGYKTNAKNASFDYLIMQFRLHPRLALTAGITPFTKVGYNFTQVDSIKGSNDKHIMNTLSGEGGSQNIFIGLGFKILKNLSVGVNVGYLYGKQKYNVLAQFDNEADNTIKYNHRKINSYKLDFGLQYIQKINEKNELTLGAVYGLGHNLNTTETKGIQTTDGKEYSVTDEEIIENGYSLPHSFGLGLAYNYKKSLTLALDYGLQKWSSATYAHKDNMYNDRHRVAFGMEYVPNRIGRNYFKRIAYRAGTYYNTSYLKTPGGDGPKEIGVTAGFGFPLQVYGKNTVLSITGQYTRLKPSVNTLMKEDRFMLKVGLTFNDNWFMKWRVN